MNPAGGPAPVSNAAPANTVPVNAAPVSTGGSANPLERKTGPTPAAAATAPAKPTTTAAAAPPSKPAPVPPGMAKPEVKAPAPAVAPPTPPHPAAAPAQAAATPPPPAAEPALPDMPLYYQLPYNVRKDLPALAISMHVYANSPAQRFVVVDGERKAEGETVKDGLTVHEIRADGVIFEFRGQRFFYPRPGGR
jgi:general secretion pathway protein B